MRYHINCDVFIGFYSYIFLVVVSIFEDYVRGPFVQT